MFPFTLVFFVDLNPANPIIRRISAVSGSSSMSIACGVLLFCLVFSVAAEVPLAFGGLEVAAALCFEVPGLLLLLLVGGLCELRGPVGGILEEGWVLLGLWGRSRCDLEDGGGVRVRVGLSSLRLGERERERWRSGRRWGSSVEAVSHACGRWMRCIEWVCYLFVVD